MIPKNLTEYFTSFYLSQKKSLTRFSLHCHNSKIVPQNGQNESKQILKDISGNLGRTRDKRQGRRGLIMVGITAPGFV